jgi:DegV family protein with EDD domain
MGFQVLAVARAVEDGASLDDAVALAEKTREHTGVYFAVDTLEFLHRGGRIGGAQRFLGTALNMKPVLAVIDGRVDAVERIRTKSKALERVLELVMEQTKGKTPIHLATLHASSEEEARTLLDKASKVIERHRKHPDNRQPGGRHPRRTRDGWSGLHSRDVTTHNTLAPLRRRRGVFLHHFSRTRI